MPWPDQLEMISGKRKLDASALIEYFQPLYLYLVKSNRENGVSIAWNVYSGRLFSKMNRFKKGTNFFFSTSRVLTSRIEQHDQSSRLILMEDTNGKECYRISIKIEIHFSRFQCWF